MIHDYLFPFVFSELLHPRFGKHQARPKSVLFVDKSPALPVVNTARPDRHADSDSLPSFPDHRLGSGAIPFQNALRNSSQLKSVQTARGNISLLLSARCEPKPLLSFPFLATRSSHKLIKLIVLLISPLCHCTCAMSLIHIPASLNKISEHIAHLSQLGAEVEGSLKLVRSFTMADQVLRVARLGIASTVVPLGSGQDISLTHSM